MNVFVCVYHTSYRLFNFLAMPASPAAKKRARPSLDASPPPTKKSKPSAQPPKARAQPSKGAAPSAKGPTAPAKGAASSAKGAASSAKGAVSSAKGTKASTTSSRPARQGSGPRVRLGRQGPTTCADVEADLEENGFSVLDDDTEVPQDKVPAVIPNAEEDDEATIGTPIPSSCCAICELIINIRVSEQGMGLPCLRLLQGGNHRVSRAG